MSKAFTKEDDERPEEALPPRPPASGLPKSITAEGYERLRVELGELEHTRAELRRTTSADEDPHLRRIEMRVAQLGQCLATAEIVVPDPNRREVQFGSKVEIRDETGARIPYQIVGVSEADFEQGKISCTSPLARALINAKKGQTVSVPLPGGEQRFTVLEIS